MNPYLKNLNRIEFLITFACTGRCKHCSEGDHSSSGPMIDGDKAAEAVRRIAEMYTIESLMTFGGEPMLNPEAVCKIHEAAREAMIPKRQLITNGFFTRDTSKIRDVADALAKSGVTDVLLSVDAFHQETIPLDIVMEFANACLEAGVPQIRSHPAWLVSETAENPYNRRTHEILSEFERIGVSASGGNIIFPAGNALKYFSEYFDLSVKRISPYYEDPKDLHAICVGPDGGVLGGNINRTDVLEIFDNYKPEES